MAARVDPILPPWPPPAERARALSRISSFDWFGSVALNPVGYALIGPIAGLIGTPETLVAAAVLNIAVCLSVVLVASTRSIGMAVPAPIAVAASE